VVIACSLASCYPAMLVATVLPAVLLLVAVPRVCAEVKDVSASSTANFEPIFVSSDSKQLLFSTTVKVDEVDHQVDVRDGDNPVQVALKFANAHKIGQAGFEKVLLHLKQRALVTGHMKRVFFALPVRAEKDKTQQVLNLTIYEDTEPEILAKKVSELYGLNAGQQAKLAATIEREMVAHMKLRTKVDMSEYGVGKQTLVVRRDETALKAVQRFAQYMAEVGIKLTPKGIDVLAERVEESMFQARVTRAQLAATEGKG